MCLSYVYITSIDAKKLCHWVIWDHLTIFSYNYAHLFLEAPRQLHCCKKYNYISPIFHLWKENHSLNIHVLVHQINKLHDKQIARSKQLFCLVPPNFPKIVTIIAVFHRMLSLVRTWDFCLKKQKRHFFCFETNFDEYSTVRGFNYIFSNLCFPICKRENIPELASFLVL